MFYVEHQRAGAIRRQRRIHASSAFEFGVGRNSTVRHGTDVDPGRNASVRVRKQAECNDLASMFGASGPQQTRPIPKTRDVGVENVGSSETVSGRMEISR